MMFNDMMNEHYMKKAIVGNQMLEYTKKVNQSMVNGLDKVSKQSG